jgi:hypothetical protein
MAMVCGSFCDADEILHAHSFLIADHEGILLTATGQRSGREALPHNARPQMQALCFEMIAVS